MKFPRTASANADAQTDAKQRLDEARDDERAHAERRDAAEPGPREIQAETELSVATDQVAAREAWAKWAADDE